LIILWNHLSLLGFQCWNNRVLSFNSPLFLIIFLLFGRWTKSLWLECLHSHVSVCFLHHCRVILQFCFQVESLSLVLFIWSTHYLFPFLNFQNLLAPFNKLDLMGHKNDKFVFKCLLNALFENCSGYFRINCTQRIIKKIDICIWINSSGQRHPCFLSTRDVYSSFTYHGFFFSFESVDISDKLTGFKSFLESLFIILKTKADIIFYGSREDKWLLLYIGNSTLDCLVTCRPTGFTHQGMQKSWFSTSHCSSHYHKLFGSHLKVDILEDILIIIMLGLDGSSSFLLLFVESEAPTEVCILDFDMYFIRSHILLLI